MLHQTLLNRLSWFNKLGQSNHFSAVLALSLSLILAACGGGGSSVTENNLVEPGADGVAPTLTSVTIANDFDSSAYVALDDVVLLEFESDEALMQPTVMLGGVAADVSGSVRSWKATRAMVEGDEDGVIEFTKEEYDKKVNNDEIIVYTSGHGGLFKPGLPVGKINNKNLKKNIVNFFSDFGQLDYVKIVSFEMGSGN